MIKLAELESSPIESSIWAKRLRWFFAEITVVVAGILLALGLQSWWQGRENAVRAVAYKQQILADARKTRDTYKEANAVDKELRAATARLSEALHNKQALQNDDAMQWLPWRSGWFDDPRPVVGNLYSLIDTGEIQLIQNPKIRTAIIEYASIMKGGTEDVDGQPERMRRANDLEQMRLEVAEVPMMTREISETGTIDVEPLKDYLPLYTAAWPILRNDAQYRFVQNSRLMAYDNMARYREEMLLASEKLIAVLEADEIAKGK